MKKYQFNKIPIMKLLGFYSGVMEALRTKKVLRSSNNPVADYGEFYVAKKLRLELAPKSNKAYDAFDKSTSVRFQIKSRRITQWNTSRQLGVIRNLFKSEFDFLVAIIFNESFRPIEMYKIPRNIIHKYARFSKLQNGHILIMSGLILRDPERRRIL